MFIGFGFLNKCPTTKVHLDGLQDVINETKSSGVNNMATDDNESYNVKTMLSAIEEEEC